jgi:hypothetical protein
MGVASWGMERKAVLIFSMVMNLGFLGFFKYFGFFADNLAALITSLGMQPSWTTLNIILPVGISFYTFQSMSYTIDVYRREIEWEPSLVEIRHLYRPVPAIGSRAHRTGGGLSVPDEGGQKIRVACLAFRFGAGVVGLFQKNSDCRFARTLCGPMF